MIRYQHSFVAMACTADVQLYAVNAASAQQGFAAVQAEVERIEAKYSRYRDDSQLSAINRGAGGAPVSIDAETSALLDYADACWRESGGKFDITSGVLRHAWDFRRGVLPDPVVLARTLERVGWSRVQRMPDAIALERDMEIDFGGIGKEYAADRAAAAATALGVTHALINLGGDIRVTGPHADGTPWHVGITDPREVTRTIARIPLSAGGLATSGDYERFFIRDGRRCCHILDPRSGWPVAGPQSVTVVAPLCTVAGSCATIAMLNEGRAAGYLQEQGLPFLLVDADGAISGPLIA